MASFFDRPLGKGLGRLVSGDFSSPKKRKAKKMSGWTNFMKGKMGPYMKKYGSHQAAIRQLSMDYKREKGGNQ